MLWVNVYICVSFARKNRQYSVSQKAGNATEKLVIRAETATHSILCDSAENKICLTDFGQGRANGIPGKFVFCAVIFLPVKPTGKAVIFRLCLKVDIKRFISGEIAYLGWPAKTFWTDILSSYPVD